jgi:CheY-like chemotaxis protein
VEAPPAAETLEHFCEMGNMVCDMFKKLGGTCKAGMKKSECPKLKAQRKRAAAQKAVSDTSRLISVDQPFDYEEVVAVTGAEYVAHLHHEGMSVLPYEELKQNVSQMLEREAAQEASAAVADYPGLPKEPVQRNILVIDDEVAVNNNIRKILAKKGFHVDQAVTKDEAIDKLGIRTYKLVLLDLKIPGVKGLELLEAIRDKNPKAKVIIITGYASIDTAVESAKMGAIGYIPKPFTPTEIRTATENAFRIAA